MLTNLQSEKVYEERLNEVRYAFDKVHILDSQNSDADFVCICKSNIILMIYNLVESTVVNTMNEYYSLIFKDPNFVKKNEKILGIWIDSIMISSYGRDKSFNDCKNTAHSLISKYSKNELRSEYRKNDSGNLDARTIQKMCETHSINFIKSKKYEENELSNQLREIKETRNVLAHGEQSFIEIGRNLSEKDLAQDIELVAEYLQCFLKSVDKYIVRVGLKQI